MLAYLNEQNRLKSLPCLGNMLGGETDGKQNM